LKYVDGFGVEIQRPTLEEALNAGIEELILESWVEVRNELPKYNHPVMCKLQSCVTDRIEEHRLLRVDETDCEWRTTDDNSEISYNWTVIEWRRLMWGE